MIAKHLATQAILAGKTVRFITASEMLNTLAEQDSSLSLRRKLTLFTSPQLLVIDELGYLSYDPRHAAGEAGRLPDRYNQIRPHWAYSHRPAAIR